jgi:hypothetical protein
MAVDRSRGREIGVAEGLRCGAEVCDPKGDKNWLEQAACLPGTPPFSWEPKRGSYPRSLSRLRS